MILCENTWTLVAGGSAFEVEIMLRERGPVVAVNPGIPPAIVAAAVGRPLRTFEVRPRILAGTAQIPGAVEVRSQDLRQGRVWKHAVSCALSHGPLSHETPPARRGVLPPSPAEKAP